MMVIVAKVWSKSTIVPQLSGRIIFNIIINVKNKNK
jgi:hypothetical protein